MSKSLNVYHRQDEEDEEEERKRRLLEALERQIQNPDTSEAPNLTLRQELEKQFQKPIHEQSKEKNLFDEIDTSNMNLRQELEAKFKALNKNPYQTKITPDLFKADNDNDLEDEEIEPIYRTKADLDVQKTRPFSAPKKDLRNCTTIDDVYYSDHKKINTQDHEGKYNFGRKNDAGGPTNYGITQHSLEEYNNWNSPYRQGYGFPSDVKDLTNEQAKQILDEMYFKRYNIDKLCHNDIARNVFDIVMSTTNQAPKFLADSINQVKNTNFNDKKVISDELADFSNTNLNTDEIRRISDLITQKGMDYYFKSVDRRPQNINNLNGWYNRRKSYYSNPEEFERLYKKLLEEYFKKYGVYYNGK